MGEGAGGAVLTAVLQIGIIPAAVWIVKQRTITEQAVEIRFIRIVARKTLALRIAEIRKALVSPFDVRRGLFFCHTASLPG